MADITNSPEMTFSYFVPFQDARRTIYTQSLEYLFLLLLLLGYIQYVHQRKECVTWRLARRPSTLTCRFPRRRLHLAQQRESPNQNRKRASSNARKEQYYLDSISSCQNDEQKGDRATTTTKGGRLWKSVSAFDYRNLHPLGCWRYSHRRFRCPRCRWIRNDDGVRFYFCHFFYSCLSGCCCLQRPIVARIHIDSVCPKLHSISILGGRPLAIVVDIHHHRA